MLHTKCISHGPHGFREEDFLSFSHYQSIRGISGHGGHLGLRTVTIFTNFQSPFNTKLHINGFRGEVVQRCGQTDRQMDRWTDDGQRVITIAHPKPVAQVS